MTLPITSREGLFSIRRRHITSVAKEITKDYAKEWELKPLAENAEKVKSLVELIENSFEENKDPDADNNFRVRVYEQGQGDDLKKHQSMKRGILAVLAAYRGKGWIVDVVTQYHVKREVTSYSFVFKGFPRKKTIRPETKLTKVEKLAEEVYASLLKNVRKNSHAREFDVKLVSFERGFDGRLDSISFVPLETRNLKRCAPSDFIYLVDTLYKAIELFNKRSRKFECVWYAKGETTNDARPHWDVAVPTLGAFPGPSSSPLTVKFPEGSPPVDADSARVAKDTGVHNISDSLRYLYRVDSDRTNGLEKDDIGWKWKNTFRVFWYGSLEYGVTIRRKE